MNFIFSALKANPIRACIVCCATLIICVGASSNIKAQGTFTLTPDSVFITGGVGVEFDLSLDVDADVVGLKLYQIMFSFDKIRIDTVSITEGPLMGTSGSPSAPFFDVLLNDDSTVLTIQSLIFGAGFTVDGPGNLATIRLRILDTGLVNFDVVSLAANDVDNDPFDPLPTTTNSVFLINLPPAEFDLQLPADASSLLKADGQTIEFDWDNSVSTYVIGSSISYTFQYSTDISFPPASTNETPGLVSSDYSLLVDGLGTDDFFWRVIAEDDNGFIRQSSQTFTFHLDLNIPPADFDLAAPANGAVLSRLLGQNIEFSWNASSTPYPSNPLTYTLEYSTSPSFDLPSTTTVSGIPGLLYVEQVDVLTPNVDYFWRVTAIDGFDLMTQSAATRMFELELGCCLLAGDADDGGDVNIGDAIHIVEFVFQGGTAPPCCDEADADGGGDVNIGDAIYIVKFAFVPDSPAPVCPNPGQLVCP